MTQQHRDIAALAQAAIKYSNSLTVAVHWLLYIWRSNPSPEERAIRDGAILQVIGKLHTPPCPCCGK